LNQKDEAQVELKINGVDVEINPFVHEVIKNVTLGLVSSLRLEKEVEKIELKITDL
jgi:hypothetical protein